MTKVSAASAFAVGQVLVATLNSPPSQPKIPAWNAAGGQPSAGVCQSVATRGSDGGIGVVYVLGGGVRKKRRPRGRINPCIPDFMPQHLHHECAGFTAAAGSVDDPLRFARRQIYISSSDHDDHADGHCHQQFDHAQALLRSDRFGHGAYGIKENRAQRTPAGTSASDGQQVCWAIPVSLPEQTGVATKACGPSSVAGSTSSLSNHIMVTVSPIFRLPEIRSAPCGGFVRPRCRQTSKSWVARWKGVQGSVSQFGVMGSGAADGGAAGASRMTSFDGIPAPVWAKRFPAEPGLIRTRSDKSESKVDADERAQVFILYFNVAA